MTKAWPFECVQFGNAEQIAFLEKERTISEKIAKALGQRGRYVEYEEATFHVASCPHCHHESEPHQSQRQAFDEIAEKLGEEEGLFICSSCETPLLK